MPDTEITVAPKFNTVAKAQKSFFAQICEDLGKLKIKYTEYGKECGYNLLMEVGHLLAKEGLQFDDPSIDQASITGCVQYVMKAELNIANKEVFINFRNEEQGEEQEVTKTNHKTNEQYTVKEKPWLKRFECKEQYRGRMKLIKKFGVDVKEVFPIWIVREGDDFSYATYKGVEMTPPSWSPKGYTNKVIRVVVPIRYKSGNIEYHIAELESVATNIKAQIKQVLISWKGKDSKHPTHTKDNAKKIALLIKDMTLDQLLACDELEKEKLINSTYTGISKEEMYITKLTLNATKRVMIDYGSAYINELAEKQYDNSYDYEDKHHAREVIEEQEESIEEITIEEPKEIGEIKTDDNGEVVNNNKDTLTPEDFVKGYNKRDDSTKIDPPEEFDDDDLAF